MATQVNGRAAGVWDYAAMFISSGNLTKTASYPSSGMKLRGTPVDGLAVRIHFPDTPGLSATVLPEIQGSVDDSTYHTVSKYPGGALSWASGTKDIVFPFEMISNIPYAKLKFTITGGSTATSFGAVIGGITVRSHGEWTRKVRFG
jgi:hypothetical protein